jgi:hypothetical protein
MQIRLDLCAFAFLWIAPLPARSEDAAVADAQRNFTDRVAQAVNALQANDEARAVAPLRLEIRGPDGVKEINLERVYKSCKGDHTTCRAAFLKLLGEIPEAGASFAAAPKAEQVRVIVRPTAYVEPLSSSAGEPVAEPLADDLWVVAVRDAPTSIATLAEKDLAPLGFDLEGALGLGERNLEPQFKALIAGAVKAKAPGVAGISGDEYTASLLATPDLWQPLVAACGGKLYVAAPAATSVLFVDAREPGALDELKGAVRAFLRSERSPLSRAIFEWTPTGWKVLARAAD